MTPEITPIQERLRIAEKNKHLHRLLGWKRHNLHPAYWTKGDPDALVPNVSDLALMPDYCHDLNAVHSVVMGLPADTRAAYRSRLGLTPMHEALAHIDASAEIRVDALILTLEAQP